MIRSMNLTKKSVRTLIECREVSLRYGDRQVIKNINLTAAIEVARLFFKIP